MYGNWKTAVFLLILLVITACIPTDEIASETADLNETATPPPIPTLVLQPPELSGTAVAPLPLVVTRPLSLETAPATLPVYQLTLAPIAATEEEALAWSQSFGLPQPEVMERNDEMIRLLSRDTAVGIYEELTFLRTAYERVIVYSSGIDGQDFSGPTPTPNIETPSLLSPEMVTTTALDFVREHNLMPEPLLAHEFPSYDDRYLVHVTTALSNLRLTGIGEVPGVTVRIDDNGRVTEARIVPASVAAAEMATVQPLFQVYAVFMQGTAQNVYYYERAQLGSDNVQDFMRFQAHSQPYGEQDDRVELVYAPLPLQTERLVPMWLITRPDEQTWDHYVEYYLLAIEASIPRPMPSPTPQQQTSVETESVRIVSPLIVDGENGRLYTNAAVNGITRTVSLDATLLPTGQDVPVGLAKRPALARANRSWR